jgi:hypothetical protein
MSNETEYECVCGSRCFDIERAFEHVKEIHTEAHDGTFSSIYDAVQRMISPKQVQ